MKVVWVAMPTEVEHDVLDDCAEAGIGCEVWSVHPDRPGEGTRWRHVDAAALPRLLEEAAADLVVLRYPTWATEELRALDGPIVAWSSEQGPTREAGERSLVGFRHRAVNNRADADIRHGFDGTLYLPFGCALRSHYHAPKVGDLIADGGAHYLCRDCGGDAKARSVDVMVRPLIEAGARLSLFGANNREHGWAGVPGAADGDPIMSVWSHYCGTFPPWAAHDVYRRFRAYVGISWNHEASGYGCKLARAMASGIPVVWHRTPHMALDGLVETRDLLCSSSPAETLAAARQALDDPYLGGRGREFALSHWRWSDNLKRIAAEVS